MSGCYVKNRGGVIAEQVIVLRVEVGRYAGSACDLFVEDASLMRRFVG